MGYSEQKLVTEQQVLVVLVVLVELTYGCHCLQGNKWSSRFCEGECSNAHFSANIGGNVLRWVPSGPFETRPQKCRCRR